MTTQTYLNRVGNLLDNFLIPNQIKTSSIINEVTAKEHIDKEDMIKLQDVRLIYDQNIKLIQQLA